MPNEFEYDKSRLKASLDHGYLPVHVPPVSPKITAIAIVGGVTCFVVSVRSFGALWGWITLAVYVFCAWVLSGTREGLYRRKLERILDNGFAVTHEEYRLVFPNDICPSCSSRDAKVKTTVTVESYGGPDFFTSPSYTLGHTFNCSRCHQTWTRSESVRAEYMEEKDSESDYRAYSPYLTQEESDRFPEWDHPKQWI